MHQYDSVGAACHRGLRPLCVLPTEDPCCRPDKCTPFQVDFIKDLHAHLSSLYESTICKPELRDSYPKPSFKVVVLYVDEATSINRQLARQAKSEEHNKKVREARAGTIMCATSPLPLLSHTLWLRSDSDSD
jgi:hypothetical protein